MEHPKAFRYWRLWHYEFGHFEDEVSGVPSPGHGPWLKKVRRMFYLSQASVEKRLGKRYQNLEEREAKGTISLNELRTCAEALDCDFIYWVRPRERPSERIFKAVLKSMKIVPKHEWQIANRVRTIAYDPRFRRRQGWAQNDQDAARPFAYECSRL